MSEQTRGSASGAHPLPDNPSLEWLRKAAKHRLREMRQSSPGAKLADAQFALAREHGFSSWRALKTHIEALTLDGKLFAAAKKGDLETLTALIDEHPDKLLVRDAPYEHTLLHAAAQHGHLPVVDLLLRRGIDANVREKGDNTYPMHWAAAAGRLDVVRRLADAGGDVIGSGDDHALEVIGWATGWEGCDDAAHRAVADFLVSRGARHHIYSAMALNDEAEVRRVVATDPSQLRRPQSHNEDFQLPLHFAVRKQLPRMVELLIELGSDPLGRDQTGFAAPAQAEAPDVDRPVLEAIQRAGKTDIFTALGLKDWQSAERLLREKSRGVIEPGGSNAGTLHLMSKRGDSDAVRWLLEHGSDPNVMWAHWDAEVTPLHLAALGDHAEVARMLLAGGADPRIRDTRHASDALEWAEFFGRVDIVKLLKN